MMRLAAFLITFCAITPVWALTCKTDSAGGSCAEATAVAADCTSLGFKKEDVSGCKHYLYCPFDQSYKACVAKGNTETPDECAAYTLNSCPTGAECSSCDGKYKIDSCKDGYAIILGTTCVPKTCDGYTLNSCPANAANCSECKSGTTIKYKVDSCEDGYHLSENTCVVNSCIGYTLTSCPTGATCDQCVSGTTTKYRKTGCENGYVVDGNTCYNCTEMNTKLSNVTKSRDYYLYCNVQTGGLCKETTAGRLCAGSGGWYSYDDPCIIELTGVASPGWQSPFRDIHGNEITGTGLPGRYCYTSDQDLCKRAEIRLQEVLEHHNEICPSYQVTGPDVSYFFNCDSYAYESGYPYYVNPNIYSCTWRH